MPKVIVDAALRQKLEQWVHPVELCDEAGRVLGRFVPQSVDQGPREPQISEEELVRREQSNERRYSTKEVLAHLEKLNVSR